MSSPTGSRPCATSSGRRSRPPPSTKPRSSATRCATARRRSRGAPVASAAPRPLLSVNNIEVIYDHVILVLKGVSLGVPQGRIVALLGANGAGKTTTLKAISNLLRAERGDVTKGTIEFKGRRVDRLTPNELVKLGI